MGRAAASPARGRETAEMKGTKKNVADEKKPTKSNEISDQTGQYDARFMLWRAFCVQNGVPVETLPSELQGEKRDIWEKLKEQQLHKPAEEGES
ncbi:MAG TPA: hypothetical protein VER08_03445 [Pyrinomonadaceae bacterium]|nr:hypothetical protein [Pyrinomonadaceae bacterium]